MHWIVGLGLSLLVGGIATGLFVAALRRERGQFKEGLLVGIVERTFFTLVVAFDLSGAAIAMVAWVAAKMATNWNQQRADDRISETALAKLRMSAMLGGLVSMTFALLGGLLCRS